MADDKMKLLEARLTRLEAALTQQPAATTGFTPPAGVVSDPAPWPWGFHPRYPRWPQPIVDPAPWPPFVSDPAPWPPFVSDPAPSGGGVFTNQAAASQARTLGRIGQVGGDPPPPDFSRLSASQLEITLHSINAEKARLDSMGSLVQRHLDRANLAEKKG